MNQITTQKKTYKLINAMRLIAAFFVVAIHVRFPGVSGQCVIAAARFAVPFFFMTSGFFSFYENRDVVPLKLKHKIKHTLYLTCAAMLLYFIVGAANSIKSGALTQYVLSLFSVKSLASFFLFNNTAVSELLWFLPALLYVYVIFYIFEKTGITKKCLFLVPLLLVGGIIFREIKEIAPNYPSFLDNSFIYRNFLFVGLPFFLMGYFIRVNLDKLTEKLSDGPLILMMALGLCESLLVDVFHTQKSVYLGTVLSVFALFVFTVKKEDKIHLRLLPRLGADYSLYIYIFHFLVKEALTFFGGSIAFVGKLLSVLEPVMPIVVFLITLAVAAVWVRIKKSVKNIKNHKEKA